MRQPPQPHAVYQRVRDLLGTIPALGQRIYVGHVPDTLPTVNDYVLPYAVVWPGAGTPERDDPAARVVDSTGQRYPFTTTLAGADALTVLQGIGEVKRALTGARVGDGQIVPDPYQQEAQTVQVDTDVSPARSFLPLVWHLHITHL